MENIQFTHPDHELTGRELKEWLTTRDLLIQLSPKQCNLIIQALHQEQYNLASTDKSLCIVYTDAEGLHVQETTIDDVIDLACELSYEKLNILKSELAQCPHQDIDAYLSSLNTLDGYSKKYQKLLDAHTQTAYYKNMVEALEQCKEQTSYAKNKEIHKQSYKKR